MAQKILNRIHENSGMCDGTIVSDIDKADDIIRNCKDIRDNYDCLTTFPIAQFSNLFFGTYAKKKKIIELIKTATNNLVQKYK